MKLLAKVLVDHGLIRLVVLPYPLDLDVIMIYR